MCSPKHTDLQQLEYFKTPQEVALVLNLRLAGRSYDKVADLYGQEYPDQGRPNESTVRAFFKNHADVIGAELKRIKPGVLLAEVRSRLALLQDLIYESVDAYREHLGSADPEDLAHLSKLFDKIIKGLNEMAVQCGDTLVSQTPQGSGGDRPQIFQTVLVEKLVNQTLIVSDGEAEKQSGTKKAGGELLSAQPSISDSSGPASSV